MRILSVSIILLFKMIVTDAQTNDWEMLPVNNRTYSPIEKLPDTIQAYKWNALSNIWDNNYLDLYYYDEDWKESKYVRKIWDDSSHLWKNVVQVHLTYEGDKLVLEMTQGWDEMTGDWLNQTLNNYIYDIHGFRTESIYQTWEGLVEAWVNSTKQIYTYDTAGQKTSITGEAWDPLMYVWSPLDLKEYTYDIQNYNTEILYRIWDPSPSSWINSNLKTYTYDSVGNQTSMLSQNWNQVALQWINARIDLFTYNTSGNKIEALTRNWDDAHKEWDNSTLYHYYYNDINLVTNWSGEIWDKNNGLWINDTQGFYLYDNDGYRIDETTQKWDQNEESWDNYSHFRKTYIINSYGVSELHPETCNCYLENSFHQNAEIHCNGLASAEYHTFYLYDLKGILIYQTSFTGNENIRINTTLQSGIYLLVIKKGDKTLLKTKSLIIHH